MEDEIEELDAEVADIDDKIQELRSAKEPTEEQKKELATLQADKKSRLSKRTTMLLGRTKAAEERARKAEERLRDLEEKFTKTSDEFSKRLPTATRERQKVKFDGEEFFTDTALQQMVNEGEMTEAEAWEHQEARRVAAAAERIAKKDEKKSFERTRQETIASVLEEYPQLNPSHPKYNLKDPFTAEVDRLLRNGYQFKPDGLKNAVEDAKKLLRITDKRPDLSDEFSVNEGGSGSGTERKPASKVTLLDWEQENAIRMYVNTGMTNPKTGKVYTKQEAIEKALQAKQRRAEELAAR